MSEFEHVNLKDIDPSQQALPEQNFNFQIVAAKKATFTYKNGKNAGSEGTRYELGVAITDSPEYRGRRIYTSLFEGTSTLKQLRLLMDATGVPQEEGQSLTEWVESLPQAKATFNAPVAMADETDQSGQPVKRPRVNYWRVGPVAA